MADRAAKIRLHVTAPLAEGAPVPLSPDQTRYLCGVMRLGPDDPVAAFNGRDGEWLCRLDPQGRKAAALHPQRRLRAQTRPRDLWLLAAPIRRARFETVAEKAAELGAARLIPVPTRFTRPERPRPDRLRALMTEAAEQCGGLWVPDLAEPTPLDALLDAWPADRRLMLCDETRTAPPAPAALAPFAAERAPWAVLIGPEGGFAPEELDRLRALPQAVPVSLGPRVLRADTAAIAALALWQVALGDWPALAEDPA